MDDTIARIREHWSSFDHEVREAFVPVGPAMLAVKQAADRDVTALKSKELESRMRAAIERLREICAEAAQGQMLPCLLSWPVAR